MNKIKRSTHLLTLAVTLAGPLPLFAQVTSVGLAGGASLEMFSTSTPTIAARGATNQTLQLTANGTSGVDLMTDYSNNYLARFSGSGGSTANYWQFSASGAGNAVSAFASGSDANVDVRLGPKGSGIARIVNSSGTAAPLTAGSFNNVVITAPGSTATLALASGSTLTTPGAYTYTMPAATSTIASLTGSVTSGNMACMTTTGIQDCGVAPITSAPAGSVWGNSGSAATLPSFVTSPVLGSPAVTSGTLGLANGGTSGKTITIQNVSATAANYNFNLPATAGTAGYVLLSGGGGASPMTWANSLTLGDGSVSAPTYSFASSSNSGVYYAASPSTVGLGVNGKLGLAVHEGGTTGNYVAMFSNNTPSIVATGPGTNVNLQLSGKGTWGVDLMANNTNTYIARFGVNGGAGAQINYWEIKGNVTGSPVELIASGTDTDVSMTFTPKGAGIIKNVGPVQAQTSLMVGSSTSLTLATGEVGIAKVTASGSAPGAAGAKLSLVCGTNAGTAKLVISAGTSSATTTIIDNIGSGVGGC